METGLLKEETKFVMRSEMSIHKKNSSTFYDYERAKNCTVPIDKTRMFSLLQTEHEKNIG